VALVAGPPSPEKAEYTVSNDGHDDPFGVDFASDNTAGLEDVKVIRSIERDANRYGEAGAGGGSAIA